MLLTRKEEEKSAGGFAKTSRMNGEIDDCFDLYSLPW